MLVVWYDDSISFTVWKNHGMWYDILVGHIYRGKPYVVWYVGDMVWRYGAVDVLYGKICLLI